VPNKTVTVQMLMEYLSKYPPYYKITVYRPPLLTGYRVQAPRVTTDNPWMHSKGSVYIPIQEVRSIQLPKYNTYKDGIDGRTIRNTAKRKQRNRIA
jgi:hypothetical protein